MTVEQTETTLRIREFERVTQNAVPNSEESRAAQRFFKQNYMGLTEQDHGHLLGTFPNVPTPERPFLQNAFVQGLQALTLEAGNTPQTPDVRTMIDNLPQQMRHTVHKVGLECGMSQPR